jgi:hypothetical protein
LDEPYATRPQGPLSLPIRMEQKRKRTRTGIIALIAGVALLGGAAYNFADTGSELIAIYLTVMGVLPLVLGVTLLVRASRSR